MTLIVDDQRLEALREATLDESYISLGSRRTSSVHEFYRYPARFSPSFVRACIEAFTRHDGLVLDPFAGGGTALVESQLAGRPVVGSDISPLAIFVSKAKTTVYSQDTLALVDGWAGRIDDDVRLNRPVFIDDIWIRRGYLRNVSTDETWRLRDAIALAIRSLMTTLPQDAQPLARCALLRTGQWALDMRRELPTVAQFRETLAKNTRGMVAAATAHSAAVHDAGQPQVSVIHRGLPGLDSEWSHLYGDMRPELVVTSPPYPGVYALYHRWKVQGRRESPAPFWIAGSLDGRGQAHYTMAARTQPDRSGYFDRLSRAMRGLRRIVGRDTVVVQMVGFPDAELLRRYLGVMRSQGFSEQRMDILASGYDGRLWRRVPSRRWWVTVDTARDVAPGTGREVVLIFRPS